MATLIYNGVILEVERTLDYTMSPVTDPTGIDVLFHRIDISVACIFNPAATVHPDVKTTPVTVLDTRRRLGRTLRDLEKKLMQPRRELTFAIGPDIVIDVPASGEGNTASDQLEFDLCDPDYGPMPRYCRAHQIVGAKTAFVVFSITCAIQSCKKLLLSNRWSVRCSINTEGFTTRIINGLAIIRAEAVAQREFNIDDFRRALLVPPPREFQRHVDFSLDESSRELRYTLTDTQTYLGLGQDSPATRVEGHAQTTLGLPAKTYLGLGKQAAEIVGNLPEGGLNAFANKPAAVLGAIGGLVNMLPVANVSGVVRVWGRDDSFREDLAQIGIDCLTDRFDPLTIKMVHSISVLQDIMWPYVECRLEFMTGIPFGIDFSQWMKMSSRMDAQAPLIFNENRINRKLNRGQAIARDARRPALRSDDNTDERRDPYGSIPIAMIGQILAGECEPPPSPPVNQNVQIQRPAR